MKLVAFSQNSNRNSELADEFNGMMKRLDIRDHSHESEEVVALVGSALSEVVEEIALTDIQLLPPIPRPCRNIFCVGKNYHQHAKEFAHSSFDSWSVKGEVSQAPIIFTKVPESVIGRGDIVRLEIDGIGLLKNPVNSQ